MDEDKLIESLKADLTPVRTPGSIGSVGLLWLLIGLAYVLTLAAALGPFRPGFADQLLSVPRFALEMLLGALALGCFLGAALLESIPGRDAGRWQNAGWLLLVAWLAQFLIGFAAPALEPSMLGKREHCVWEAYLYSVPLLVSLAYLQRRRYVLEPVRAMLHTALAAGLMPALMMQIACMYEPGHGLAFHVLPIGLLAGAAVVLTWLFTRRADS